MTTVTWPQAARTAVAYHAAIGDPAAPRPLLRMYEAAGCITATEARQVAVLAGLTVQLELFTEASKVAS